MKSSPAHAICNGSQAALGLVLKQIYTSNIKAKSHSTGESLQANYLKRFKIWIVILGLMIGLGVKDKQRTTNIVRGTLGMPF